MTKRKSDWKQPLSAASLVVAVAGTLILGWALQGDSGGAVDAIVVEPPVPDRDGDSSSAAMEIQSSPAPPSETDALISRSIRDLDRMASFTSGWTLQFMSACDEGNVRAKLSDLQGHDDFYLIPVTLDKGRCFRLCWGVFRTRDQALSARDVPSSLAAITKKPQPMPIDRVIR
jgi:hypothetical protein